MVGLEFHCAAVCSAGSAYHATQPTPLSLPPGNCSCIPVVTTQRKLSRLSPPFYKLLMLPICRPAGNALPATKLHLSTTLIHGVNILWQVRVYRILAGTLMSLGGARNCKLKSV